MSAVEAVPDEPVVFDLDAVIAEREPKAPFEFTFGGEAFTLPPGMDLRVIAALSTGRFDDGLRMLLGAEQWEKLQRVDAVFDSAAFESLFRAFGDHLGADLMGESQASTRSSSGTARRSRPTSRGSTK